MKLFIELCFALLALACSSRHPDTTKLAAPPQEASAKADSIPFPVYMAFGAFEPQLKRDNDTTYVINFWATWCKPCVAEFPYFEKLIREYQDRPVRVLLVSMDFPKDIKSKLIPFVEERKLSAHVVALADIDYNAWIDKVSTEWDGAIPFTLMYNTKGRKTKLGEMAGYEELNGMLKSLL
jgi:thiol-disulfide isomerase/thioredoxin